MLGQTEITKQTEKSTGHNYSVCSDSTLSKFGPLRGLNLDKVESDRKNYVEST
jgi:hypothetical protein